MSNQDQTASFVVRFTQKIFNDDQGESQVQWRGKISHVQGGDAKNFTDMSKALDFIQNKLSELTIQATKDKSPEEQDGILTKSFDMWKKLAKASPKMVMNALKDPKAQVAQIQEQLAQVGDEIGQKVEIDSWRAASKSDFKQVLEALNAITDKISDLDQKVASLQKKKK